jgi:hypothetical protein
MAAVVPIAFVSAAVTHLVAVEVHVAEGAVGVFTAPGPPSVVAVTRIESTVDMPMEVARTVKPWTGADEYAALEPLGSVVAIRRTVVRRKVMLTIRTGGRCADAD